MLLRCPYSTINFLQNPHKWHPIAGPLGWGLVCLLWIQILIYILLQSLQSYMQYHLVLERIITALDCIYLLVITWTSADLTSRRMKTHLIGIGLEYYKISHIKSWATLFKPLTNNLSMLHQKVQVFYIYSYEISACYLTLDFWQQN